MAETNNPPLITGQCYCGKIRFQASQPPKTVNYCHCSDCRRVTGAPVAAFAAFDEKSLSFSPDEGQKISKTSGVVRTFCDACGSPITGRYDYLPNIVYIALGLLDQADNYPPKLHSHEDNRLDWLHIDDKLERHSGSARAELNK